MQPDASIPVYLRSLSGAYLAQTTAGWEFVSAPDQAHVFDYLADEIPQQLEAAQRELGAILIAWPCDHGLLRETCDNCGYEVFPTSAVFDGSRFLCPACSRRSAPQCSAP